ncbi:hypothetical protein V495_00201 [Pseudogymnoascus sp. VKM F-4514 (FW-929)]|nr:hypothetical protein V495_00201 [Pseudogymnoascus sp. VKM F-4514 (FW-929)]KFY67319.1 hypothetical protein V497_00432 [Pseudogymnoascus sp. VKM F-4516 (FW-969)]
MASQYWLPPEVWTMVFHMFSTEDHDIGSVRLTCKIFEELATPFLLPPPRILCAPLSGSLATLTAVSRHPVLSKSVMEVVYDCNRYHFVETITKYKEALRRAKLLPGRCKEPKSEEENRDLKRGFSQYRQTYDNQATMENSGEVIACLCSALMRMPHIKKITISPNFECFLDTQHVDSIYFLEPDPAYNEAFLLMARVLSLTGTKIHDFNIETNDDPIGDRNPVGVNGALFRVMSSSNLNHCCKAFRGLRSVTIAADENDVDGWMTGNLAEMLSGATDLEKLNINACHPHFQIPTKYILSTTTWSRLTSLRFTHVALDQRDFLELLIRHSGTLKDIDLFSVCLTNGSWKILLEGLKPHFSLQRISIDYPSEQNGESYKEIYLKLKHASKSWLLNDGLLSEWTF